MANYEKFRVRARWHKHKDFPSPSPRDTKPIVLTATPDNVHSGEIEVTASKTLHLIGHTSVYTGQQGTLHVVNLDPDEWITVNYTGTAGITPSYTFDVRPDGGQLFVQDVDCGATTSITLATGATGPCRVAYYLSILA